MGVHGLWELLAPVGRRVSVETLAGKKLAIDASIWMIQFMKAMRDEKGEMVRNAHILGFFRRICKLLYLRTKPVFVFDGGTPALKRRTVIARRRQRENAQAKIRKTAEKLLLNHLKAMRVKELAADLEKQRQENDVKGKRPSTQDDSNVQEIHRGNSVTQEELDEMLAASIAAEEDEDFGIGASTSGAAAAGKEVSEEDDDEDEEMILPEMHGKVDPVVLAALPPSMQLDLLVQMRERLMAENRQKYQKVKKAPERFSELQIEAYLKTVAFRREIDGVQKAAAGRGIGGVQTSRIASEANREFIFSSSFTGDKVALTAVGQERNRTDQSQAPSVDSSTNAVNKVQSTKKSGAAEGPSVTETGKAFNDDVETYVDERGRLRVSRVRALGIRMTRDLQRNLDLMKESDQEKAENHQIKDNDSSTAGNLVSLLDNSSGKMQRQEASNNNNDGTNNEFDKTEEPELVNGAPIEISFDDTLEHDEHGDDEDKLFACLVAGDPVMDFSVDNSATAVESLPSASDDEWEEGFQDIQLKSSSCPDESQKNITKGALEEDAAFQEAIRRSLEDSRESMNDFHENHTSERARETVTNEDEVEWEEECPEIQLKSSCPYESQKTVAKGTLEEEAAFQEAIRRSLENTRGSMNDFHENHALQKARETVCNDEEVEWEEGFQEIQLKSSCPDESQETVARGTMEEEAAFQEAVRRSLENSRGSMDDSQQNYTLERAREEMVGGVSVCEGRERPDVETLATEVRQQIGSMSNLGTITSQANSDKSHLELKPLNQDAGESGAFSGEILLSSDAVPRGKGLCMNECQTSDTCSQDGNGLAVNKPGGTHCEKISHESSTSVFINSLPDKLVDSGSADARTIIQAELGDHFCDPEKLGTSADDSVTNVYGSKHFTKDNLDGNNSSAKNDVTRSDNKEQEIMEDDLEEVMMFLDREREELGSEQRKLERNAESVNNEMFVECQELLQMFGLPYIIAPMEAEAQCAFLELSNQVDGVVTDDSDAFLFGAQSVYKNIFDDRKYVETYLMKDIENELGLDREKLIHMALLLGSDYTEGISGIGIVNAIEVVNAFPGRDGLREFRDWIESPDPSILGKLDVGGNPRKKGSKGTENIMTDSNSTVEGVSCDQNLPLPVDDDERKRQIFQNKHRNVSKNWHISSSFPSDAVISAYASPQVDKSTEPFSWGKPDLFVLRKLCWEKFAWGASKADELLLPVLKEYNKHETQLRLEAFYTFNERFAKIRSKRIEKAVKGITGSKSSDLTKEEASQQSRSGRKRKATSCKDKNNQSGSKGLDGVGASDQSNTIKKPTVKQSKRGRMDKRTSQSNLDLEQSTSVDEHVIARKESHVRGRGRNRGRGRGQQSGRGKRKNMSSYTDAGMEDGDTSCSEHEEERLHVSEEALQVRKSARSRKTVNYSVSDESDNSEKEGATFVQGESSVVQKVSGTDESDKNQLNAGVEVGTGNSPLVEETVQSTDRTDKMSTSVIDGGQMDDPSDEYLKFGGGFCLDEDEEKETSPAGEKVPEKSDHLSDDEQNMNDIENDSENHSMKFLRAMPNLRRKRNKN